MRFQRILARLLSGSILLVTASVTIHLSNRSGGPGGHARAYCGSQTEFRTLAAMVAPIALYPRRLGGAEILAGATYPTEVVEAERWMQEHSELQGQQLADEADKQPWDPLI